MLDELDVAVATARADRGRPGGPAARQLRRLGAAVDRARDRAALPRGAPERRDRAARALDRRAAAGADRRRSVDVGLVRPPVEPDDALAHRARAARADGRGDPGRPSARAAARGSRCGGWPPSRWCCSRASRRPGFHDLLTGRLAATGTLPAGRPVRAGDADDHRPRRGRDRRLARARPRSPGWRSTGVTYRPLAGAPDTELLAVDARRRRLAAGRGVRRRRPRTRRAL